MILFAYAGNMDVERFSKTVRSAKKVGIAKLPWYNFVFNKTADDESSKANVVKSFDPDALVWGVLIELDDSEKPNFYNPDTWSSDLQLESAICLDEQENIYHVEVFIAQPHAVNNHLLPYDWYHQKIIKLALQSVLPEYYINQLMAMAYKVDTDEQRRQKKLKGI